MHGINGVGTGWIYTFNSGVPPSITSNYLNLLYNDIVRWKYVL